MLAIAQSIWDGLLGFFSLILPFGQNSFVRKMGPALRWTLHLILLALVFVLLYFVNDWLKIHERIPRPIWARHYWLPIVFLLIYSLAWTGWWIYLILAADPDPTDYPDIDEAWEQATDALNRAGIPLTEVPVYLVLGRPEAPEEHLFAASQFTWTVKQTPAGAGAPLHVYANRDAVFITCAGSSLLGKQAAILALEGLDAGGTLGLSGDELGEDDASRTLKPNENEQRILQQLAVSLGKQTTARAKRDARKQLGLRLPDLLQNAAETQRLTGRLTHLCRLLSRDRQPYCPLNGILLLIPLGATDSDQDAQQSAEIAARDLAVVRRVLKLQCPVLSMVCDVETVPGFLDFMNKQGAAARNRRIGQRFPLESPDLDEEKKFGEALRESIRWFGGNLVKNLAYPHFQIGTPDPRGEVLANQKLFVFLSEWRQRSPHLGRFVSQALTAEPWRFAGCYLAGTGVDKDREQGFVRGVIQRLFDHQSDVAWTDQALIDDARCNTWSILGYVLLIGVALGILGLLAYQIFM